MNCLFSQYVNEWSIPLKNGIEACRRLHLWLSGKEEESGIPFSSNGIFVHAPIELRVASSYDDDAWLSTAWGGPVCYIGIIMYKPFYQPVPYRRYFEAYEYLMKSLGGRPHWAKQHSMSQRDLLARYPKLPDWLKLRAEVDPNGMFITEYHKRHLLSQESDNLGVYAGMAGRHFKARL
jgi:FAD/FMN-containing dehydrogenase